MAILDDLQLLTKNWAATLVVGALVASWWRGTWVLFDLYLCNQPPEAGITTGDSFCFAGILEEEFILLHRNTGWQSLAIGYVCTFVGVTSMWMGLWKPQDKAHVDNPKTVACRIFIVYSLGMGCVNIWRAVWYLTDFYLWPGKHLGTNEWGEWPRGSFWFSSVIGSSVCFLFGAGAALLAPPGIFYIDGPGINPPPIAVTFMSTYHARTLPATVETPILSPPVMALNMVGTFVVIPFFVVWFWRGSWLVLDYYLWEFSPYSSDVWQSIGYSSVIALLFLAVTSNSVFDNIQIENHVVRVLVSRLRTYILAWGVVNYWRAVWLFWDEATGTTLPSCWACHTVPLLLLLSVGCMACIMAPASTIDLDFAAHPLAAREPLFTKLPVSAENLFVFGIGRNPTSEEEGTLIKETLATKKSTQEMDDFSQLIDVDECIAKNVEMSQLKKNEQGAEEDSTKRTTMDSSDEETGGSAHHC